jgi:ribonuclease HII
VAHRGRKAQPSRRIAATRLQDPLELERGFWSRGFRAVAGVDEVGRGPLAGPVVAAAVILPHDCVVEGADDSKRLTAGVREEVSRRVVAAAVSVRLGAASPEEIDRLNIRRATALAMQRAIAKLRPAPDHLLVDGLPVPELGLDLQTAVVGGDGRVHSIACASIVAKVFRDRLMRRLALRYPEYGWDHNMGYATADHREALLRIGPTPHHRRSFQSVDQLTLVLED